jgi:hypothetical protein
MDGLGGLRQCDPLSHGHSRDVHGCRRCYWLLQCCGVGSCDRGQRPAVDLVLHRQYLDDPKAGDCHAKINTLAIAVYCLANCTNFRPGQRTTQHGHFVAGTSPASGTYCLRYSYVKTLAMLET